MSFAGPPRLLRAIRRSAVLPSRYLGRRCQHSKPGPSTPKKLAEAPKEEEGQPKKRTKKYLTEAEVKAKFTERLGGLETEEFEDNKPTGASLPVCRRRAVHDEGAEGLRKEVKRNMFRLI
jgi:hypothetical protein